MASKSRRSTQADDDEVEYVPLPARKGLSVPDFNLNTLLRDTRSTSSATPAPTPTPTATPTGSSASRPLQSAPSTPSAPASLVVPKRFHASEESSPEDGAGGNKNKKDKDGRKKKDKKPKKEKKTSKKKREDDDEDDEGEDDHEPLGIGNRDDDDEDEGFDELDGYEELVGMQESKGPKKRPATSKAAASRKKPAKKHSEVPPFHHMIEGADAMGEHRESVESMEPADNGDMSYPTQDYVLPDPGMEQPMSPGADGVDGMRDGADGDSCYAETLNDPTSPAFSYHPDNQLGLLDTPDPSAVTPGGSADAGHKGSQQSADLTTVLDGVEPRAIDFEDGSEETMEKSLSRVDAEGAEPAPNGADSHDQKRGVATPARSASAKPKVCPSPKVRAKAKAKAKAKGKGGKTAKGSPKRKAAKQVAIAKRKRQHPMEASPKSKAAPKHKMRKEKDEVERKLHSVYSGAHKDAKNRGLNAAQSKEVAVEARLKWAQDHGPAAHPAVIALVTG